MGSCVSRPSWAGRRKKSNGTKINPESAAHDDTQRSVTLQPISVLKDPTGDDLYAKYELGKELGRGEFGVTHQCVDLDTGELLACKTISKNKLTTEVDVQDVRREVEIMKSLPKHPNIVSLKEAYEDKDNVHLVMELCAGGELFDRIVARGHYSERAAADVIKSITEIVKVCHEHGVMHRDLKPENFLFANTDEDSPLKAIDFGLSIFFTPGQRFGEIVGSPYYMAPEVLRRNYGHEIDVWSAGVILYILLCGVPPFWAETEEGIAQAIVKSHVDFERDPWPKISEDAKDLVRGMLDPNPYNRLTVEEVLDHSWIRNANNNPDVSLGENVRTRIKQFSVMNKFKKKVLRVVADNLPNDQLDGIRQTFNMMDTDNNGTLSFEELKDGLHKIGHQIADRDVKMLIEAADMEGNGTLNCDEFVTISVHLRRIGSDESLSEAFRVFDKNGSGFIEFDELREALSDDNLGPNNEQVIREIILDADLDKDGRISYEEFKAMMKTGMDWKMSSRQYSRAMLNALSTRIFKDKSMPLQYTSMKLNNKSMLLRNRSMQLRNKSSRLKH